jgi:hypothetical protein
MLYTCIYREYSLTFSLYLAECLFFTCYIRVLLCTVYSVSSWYHCIYIYDDDILALYIVECFTTIHIT